MPSGEIGSLYLTQPAYQEEQWAAAVHVSAAVHLTGALVISTLQNKTEQKLSLINKHNEQHKMIFNSLFYLWHAPGKRPLNNVYTRWQTHTWTGLNPSIRLFNINDLSQPQGTQ